MTSPGPPPETSGCPSCGTPNEVGRKFCGQCGARLAAVCPACGTANPPAVRFCGECGTQIAPPAQSGTAAAASAGGAAAAEPATEVSPADAPGGAAELKIVSVLFADLVGFTAASEERDPEAVRETLTRYFAAASTIVERYGGTVEKFIGDAVMAVWGTPVAHEDDAERAVRAALDLVDAVTELHAADDAAGLQLRAAVMTGEAAVTLGARNQGLVAGDLVNAASRLQAVAPPGSVLVDDATVSAAGAAVAFEPVGVQELRGRAQPVDVSRALRVVGKRGGVGRAENLEAPFVGRDAELRLVRELYHSVVRDHRATLVSIIGQAGIGKSRLLWEFSKYTDGLAEDLFWHEGRSPAYGEGVTFWALGEMVRQRARALEGEDHETTRLKLGEAVARHVSDESERRWIERALRQLLGVHDGPALEREELFGAWRTFFERLAAESPTVLIFEDLHWADAGQLDFIEHILEWSRNHALYVVTMARPELLERRPTWGAGQRNFTSISLEPLPDEAMGELLDGLVPGLPAPVVNAILARAGGVPLYAVETVRMLLHQGRLELVGGVYRPTGDLSRLAVPDSLHSLISARLDGLEPIDRALLQSAAVLGQTFSPVALGTLIGQSPTELEPRLRGLVRREILQLDTDPRSPERGHYGFVQALIREVAYGTLPKRDRRERHLAAARYFETLGDDEIAGVLARHYLAAYQSAQPGAEADALAAQARLALRAAAERATTLGSLEQARTYLEQALAVASDDQDRAEICERLGMAADGSGLYEESERWLRQALDFYRAVGARADAARLTGSLGSAIVRSGRPAAARELLAPAMDEFRDLDGTESWIELEGTLAYATLDDEPEAALAHADRALAAAEQLDLLPSIVDGLQTRAGALILLHRTREAKALLVGAAALAEANGLARDRLRAFISLTFMEVAIDPLAGLQAGRTGIEQASRLGMRRFVFDILGNAARCAIRAGEWDWAVTALEEALALAPEGFSDFELTTELQVIRALRGQEWLSEMTRAEAIIEGFDDPQAIAWNALALAWAAFAEGRLADALDHAERAAGTTEFYAPEARPLAGRLAYRLGDQRRLAAALEALDRSGARGQAVNADRMTMAAGLAALRAETPESVRLYHEAFERWQSLGLAWDLALCQVDFARAVPDHPEAAAVLAAARTTFNRLGAVTMLEPLDATAAGGPVRQPDPEAAPQAASGSGRL